MELKKQKILELDQDQKEEINGVILKGRKTRGK